MGMTITEGLGEIKTINKRLEKKRIEVANFAARAEIMTDPLAKSGGSEKHVKALLQAINDLEERIISIRRAINTANMTMCLKVCGVERTVADWLIWRREVITPKQGFVAGLVMGITNKRREIEQHNLSVDRQPTPQGTKIAKTELVVNVDEKALRAEMETIEKILGTLDTQLSLFNANAAIDVAADQETEAGK